MLKVTAIGRITSSDPTILVAGTSTTITFIVHHIDKRKLNGVLQQKNLWLHCSYQVKEVNLIDRLKRGSQVYIEGVPDLASYCPSGIDSTQLAVKVDKIEILTDPIKNKENESTQPIDRKL